MNDKDKYAEKYHERLVQQVIGAARMVIALNGGKDIVITCKDKDAAKESANYEK